MVENRAGTEKLMIDSQTGPKFASAPARGLLKTLTFYQRSISPALARRCRYLPTCSEYARTAIERFGAGRGVAMTARRLLRCQPFGSDGYDPVPPRHDGGKSC